MTDGIENSSVIQERHFFFTCQDYIRYQNYINTQNLANLHKLHFFSSLKKNLSVSRTLADWCMEGQAEQAGRIAKESSEFAVYF